MDRAGKPFFAHEQVDFVVGAPGRAPDGPASFCGETIGPPAGILFPPMLFAPNGLASGPQARFSAEEKGTKVKGGKVLSLIDKKPGDGLERMFTSEKANLKAENRFFQ